MIIETFNRYEKKYLITASDAERLFSMLSEHMCCDSYCENGNKYTISNIYYDTPDSSLIRNSLSKPKYKEKLRLRAYGIPDLDTRVFFEIKKKYKGIVNKRRSVFTLREAYAFAGQPEDISLKDYMNPQIIKELQYFLTVHKCEPKVYIAYDRAAYFSTDGDIRISFDSNIRTRRYDLRLEAGDYGDSLIPPEYRVMEIKASGNYPLWLCDILTQLRLSMTGFSKYGTEYNRFIQSGRAINNTNETRTSK